MKKTNLDELFEQEIKNDPSLELRLNKISRAIDIAVQIYTLRKEKNLTQAQLATIAHVRQSNIARLENADYEGYSKKTLEKIAKALDVDLAIFLISKNKINDINTMLEISQANTTSLNVFPGIGKNWIFNDINPIYIGSTIAGMKVDANNETKQTKTKDSELEVYSEFNYQYI